MTNRIHEFVRDIRGGLGEFEPGGRMSDWQENGQKNLVALTIVFCFIAMVGSCVAVPILGVSQAGSEAAATANGRDGGANNPWALDRPAQPAQD